jgi:hypothetical protein
MKPRVGSAESPRICRRRARPPAGGARIRGSATAAHLATLLHRFLAGGFSRRATPLDLLLSEPNLHDAAVLLLSVSGKNRDVQACFQWMTSTVAKRRYLGLYTASLLCVRPASNSESSGSACRLERTSASNCGAGRAGLK